MEKKYYMISYVVLLIAIAGTFYMQVQSLKDWRQWLWLLVIVIVGVVAWILSKKMKKETWFIAQTSKS